MSNSTQNDEIEVDGETYVKWDTQNDWEKRISDTYLLIRDAFWDEYLEHTTCDHDIGCVVTSDPIEKKVSLIMSTLLADARREVIEKIEKIPHKEIIIETKGGQVNCHDCKMLPKSPFCRHAQGWNDACRHILATLKEEES